MPERFTLRARDGGAFDGYLATPPSGRGAGVVVIQEIFGVNAWLRGVADWLAQRGFTALCPDLFWRQQPGVELTDRTEAEWQQARAFMKGMDEAMAMADLGAAIEQLRVHPACTGRVGAVGFCMGGRLAFRLACSGEADCCAGYYGVGIERLLEQARGLRSPLMLHMPGKDNSCPPAAQAAIHQALDGHPLATLHDYPGQDHAFARTGGRNHDARAAELANLRTLDFLARHLWGSMR
jgi:carboxymethylenebutenolidase